MTRCHCSSGVRGAGLLAGVDGFVEALGVDVEQRESGAAARQPEADGRAQSLRGAGNDEGVIFDLQDRFPSVRV